MKKSFGLTVVMAIVVTAVFCVSCKGRTENTEKGDLDTTAIEPPEDVIPDSVRENAKKNHDWGFTTTEQVMDYINALSDADEYKGGVVTESMAKYAPTYASKLLTYDHKYFIVVDKSRMKVILFDKYGKVVKEYGMACARRYGTKHKKGDCRTPEGFFTIEKIYNSTDWFYTDDYGYTSPQKGVYGPRFMRLKTNITRNVGIHGTCSPWSIGWRCSHGCIRLHNDSILDLEKYAEADMPVMVIPGKKDRIVNYKEGYDIPYFPTKVGAEMPDLEEEKKEAEALAKAEAEKKRKEEEAAAKAKKAADSTATSVASAHPAEAAPANVPAAVPDSAGH